MSRLARTFAAGNTDARSALARIEDIITVVEDDNPTTTVTVAGGKVADTRCAEQAVTACRERGVGES